MSDTDQTYTYHRGRKVFLTKRPDEFVVRATGEDLRHRGITGAEQVSGESFRVRTRSSELEETMSRSRHVGATHHAYDVAETGEEFLVTDRLFVTFREAPSTEALDAFAAKYALLQKQAYSEREFLFQLTDQTGMNPVKLVVELTENEPTVELAEHDLNQRAQRYDFLLPTDPSYQRQWHLHSRFQHPEVDPRSSSRCEEAWMALGSYGSGDVVVGVTDDGCKLDHRDFDSPDKFASWGYFEGNRLVRQGDPDADPSKMYQSGANHGTSCAGVIGGEADAVLTVGAAPACRLLPIKWESDGPSLFISGSKLRTALDFVADKVDVLTSSWGISPSSFWPTTVTNRIAELARTGGRRGRGIVFLWAAGNENCPIQHVADVDVPYTNGWSLRPDGSAQWVGVRTARRFENDLVGLPGVMHIAALASNARRSHYSNYGAGISLCAPTNNVHEYHRLQVQGLGITTTTGTSVEVTNGFGGTSSATPLTAGVAALVISANPELSAEEVIVLLKRTASKDLDFQGYPRTPSASYDLNTSWDVSPIVPFAESGFTDTGNPEGTWSPWFGHGRVDAARAVAEALQQRGGVSNELRFESSPDVVIPDNDPSGVSDVITVQQAGRVKDVRVGVAIEHTWIGDLRVTLQAPDGSEVALHQRTGGSQDNLRLTYDASSAPALASLRERSIKGNWTLRVQDFAALDVGRLQSWKLELGVSSDPVVVEDGDTVRIPDNDAAGISRELQVAADAVIDDIAVSVDITHTWIGDLRVTLTPPEGEPVLLHNRAGGSADNIVRTWRTEDLSGLGALRGRRAAGTWRLHVADVVSRDVGKLNRWRLEIG